MQPLNPTTDNRYANIRVQLATMTAAQIAEFYNAAHPSEKGLIFNVIKAMRNSGSFPAEEK